MKTTTVMYQEAKQIINTAGMMIDEGNFKTADELLKSVLGRGASVHDIHYNLTNKQLKAMIKWSRSQSKSK